jgi:hypothetical protein
MTIETELTPAAVSRFAASILIACALALPGFAGPAHAHATATLAHAPRYGDAAAFSFGVTVALEQHNLPPEDLPTPAPSPAASSGSSSPGAADDTSPAAEGAPAPAAPLQPSEQRSPRDEGASGWTRVPAEAGRAGASGTAPEASPTEAPPPYDVGSVQPAPPISDQPLTALIDATKDEPALNASLRFAEQGRKALETSEFDDAIRDLGRAISIDPTDPYAYFYLGRTYMMKKDYPQALAFFGRSEVGLRAVPAWLGEVKSFEGACLEQQGKFPQAAAAYKQALDAAPSNLMARAGYGRLSESVSDANAGNAPPPPPQTDGAALSAPETDLSAPAPPQAAPLPAQSGQSGSDADDDTDSGAGSAGPNNGSAQDGQ